MLSDECRPSCLGARRCGRGSSSHGTAGKEILWSMVSRGSSSRVPLTSARLSSASHQKGGRPRLSHFGAYLIVVVPPSIARRANARGCQPTSRASSRTLDCVCMLLSWATHGTMVAGSSSVTIHPMEGLTMSILSTFNHGRNFSHLLDKQFYYLAHTSLASSSQTCPALYQLQLF